MKTERKKRNCNVVENCRKKNSTLFNTEEELKHAEISEHGVGDPRQTKLSLFILLWFLISYFILTFSNRDLFSLLTFLSFTVCCCVENLQNELKIKLNIFFFEFKTIFFFLIFNLDYEM
jgi:hypothetical protein